MLNAVIGQGISTGIFHTLFVEPIADFRHCRALVIAFESVQDKRRGYGVNLKMLICVNEIAHRERTTVKHTLQRIVGHTANNLFGEVSRIVFSEALKHRFKDNTLCAIGNNLGSGHNLDTISF